jgi:hypothetical protein
MPCWEYQFVPTVNVKIKDYLKRDRLDPRVSDWAGYVDHEGEATLALCSRGYYAPVIEALNEWGAQGWEVACINDRPTTKG